MSDYSHERFPTIEIEIMMERMVGKKTDRRAQRILKLANDLVLVVSRELESHFILISP